MLTLLFVNILNIANAQRDVTKFMGIPIDGTYQEMEKKLVEKGFKVGRYDPSGHREDYLFGMFNDKFVNLYIVTYKQKVYRIVVRYETRYSDCVAIKGMFNELCWQFENNPKYKTDEPNQRLPTNYNVEYEMNINKQRPECYFYQISNTTKKIDFNKCVWFMIHQEEHDNKTYYGIIMFYDNLYNYPNGGDDL